MQEVIRGLKIEWVERGQGNPVLLLHGWGGRIDSFAPVTNDLCLDHRVFAIDFPGHGNSDTPTEPVCVDDFADITQKFMENHGLRGCDVVAHSFGGRVVIKLAGKDPSLFRKIVLTGAAGIRPKRTFSYYRKVYGYKFCKWAAKVPPVRGLLRMFGVNVQERIQQSGSEEYRVLPPVMRATFSKIVNEDLTKYLKKIQNPTLLLWGTEDADSPLWMAKVMEARIPDCGLVEMEGAGHFAYLERLNEFNVIVRHFFDH